MLVFTGIIRTYNIKHDLVEIMTYFMYYVYCMHRFAYA